MIVEARIGSRAKAGQVAGNFNTMLMLRVKELDTAEMLTEQLPRVEVFTLMSVSGVDDSSEKGSGCIVTIDSMLNILSLFVSVFESFMHEHELS